MSRLDLPIAKMQPDGLYEAECPSLHKRYKAIPIWRKLIDGKPIVALHCGVCDALLHEGAARDLRQPQSHVYQDGL